MANQVVNFIRKNNTGEYRIANVKSLPARTFGHLEDSDKKTLQVAVLSPQQYKELASGETLKNQDLGFYSEQEVVNAVNEVSMLKANEAEYLKTIEGLKKQIQGTEPKAETKTTKK
jgi:hypothetical protein